MSSSISLFISARRRALSNCVIPGLALVVLLMFAGQAAPQVLPDPGEVTGAMLVGLHPVKPSDAINPSMFGPTSESLEKIFREPYRPPGLSPGNSAAGNTFYPLTFTAVSDASPRSGSVLVQPVASDALIFSGNSVKRTTMNCDPLYWFSVIGDSSCPFDLAFEEPIAPPGYRCFGTAIARNLGHDPNALLCARQDLAVEGKIGAQIWTTSAIEQSIFLINQNRGDLAAWRIECPPGSIDAGGFIVTTTVTTSFVKPTRPVYCLKASAAAPPAAPPTTVEVRQLIETYAPLLKFHGAEQFLADDPAAILDDPLTTIRAYTIANDGDYDNFSKQLLGEWGTSSATLLDDLLQPLALSEAADTDFVYLLSFFGEECLGGPSDGLTCGIHLQCPGGWCQPDFFDGLDCSGGSNDGAPCSLFDVCPGDPGVLNLCVLSLKAGNLNRAEAYVRVQPYLGNFLELQFWIFYPWNGAGKTHVKIPALAPITYDPTGRNGEHYSDWESIKVRVRYSGTRGFGSPDALLNAEVSRHSTSEERARSDMELHGPNQPVVYVARDSHAQYYSADEHVYEVVGEGGGFAGADAGIVASLFDLTDDLGPLLNAATVGKYTIVSSAWPDIETSPPDWHFLNGTWGEYDTTEFCPFGSEINCQDEVQNGKPGLIARHEWDVACPINANLGSLRFVDPATPSPVGTLSPAFDPNISNYAIDIAQSLLRVTPQAGEHTAVVEVSLNAGPFVLVGDGGKLIGQTSAVQVLQPGTNTLVVRLIVGGPTVFNQNCTTTTKQYTVTINNTAMFSSELPGEGILAGGGAAQ